MDIVGIFGDELGTRWFLGAYGRIWGFKNVAVEAKSDELSRLIANPHDFIKFSAHSILLHLDEFRQLYEKGCSLREISTLTGFPISSIRKILISSGHPLRAGTKANKKELKSKPKCHSGLPPYGFIRLDGKLVVDPQEEKGVRRMLDMYKKGMSFCGISKALNQQIIPSKTGKKWNRQIVASIIKRNMRAHFRASFILF